jgi:hypothetical protein
MSPRLVASLTRTAKAHCPIDAGPMQGRQSNFFGNTFKEPRDITT